MSFADVRRKLLEQRRPKPKLPPRAPAPDSAKEALDRVKADIEARKKAKGE